MAKLPPEEKAKLLELLAELRRTQEVEPYAQEVKKRLKVSQDKCGSPVSCSDSNCTGCVFNNDSVDQPRGVFGVEGFSEEELTARPKDWNPLIPYANRGTPQDDCVIRKHGWCPRCKEALEECSCIGVRNVEES